MLFPKPIYLYVKHKNSVKKVLWMCLYIIINLIFLPYLCEEKAYTTYEV